MEATLTAPWVEIPDTFNIVSVLIDDKVADGRGDRVAIYYEDQRLTYRDVYEMTNRVGNALRGLDVRIEDRVMLVLYDCPEFVASFLGAMKIGAVPIPTNTMARPQDYEYLLNDSRAVCCIVNEDLAPKIEEIRGNLTYLRHLIVVGEAKPGQVSFGQVVGQASAELTPAQTSKDDAAFWLYTSGTTGHPKGAVHLHHDLVYGCDGHARQVLGMNENDVTFSIAKLFFAYTLGNTFTFPFLLGASTVLYPGKSTPANTLELIQRYKPTLFFCVPTMYAALLAIPDAEKKYDLRSLRLCSSAGEPLPKSLYEQWRSRFGVEILDGIGSTEMEAVFISNRIGQVRPGSTGVVTPGYEAKLVDEEGRPVARGEIGNLLMKGDSACAFYWNRHALTRKTIQGDWVGTGDKFYQDEDGYFWYVGRSDDMFKVSGQWLSPVEVENTLIEHPAVLESGVIGSKDKDGLIKPVAFVALKEGVQASPELELELQHLVKSRIAGYKVPRRVIFVPQLPKTATGKVQRFRLREELAL